MSHRLRRLLVLLPVVAGLVALAACGSSGGAATGATGATAARPSYSQLLRFSGCMRASGVPSFPDPLASSPTGRGPVLVLQGMMFVPPPGFVPGSPAFRRAASQCGVALPSASAHP